MRALLGVAVVVVRVYDVTGVAETDRRAAFEVAQELLAEANTHVIFKTCRRGDSDGEPCDTALGPNERIVRIINSPDPRPGRRVSLGHAVVDPVTNTGVLATVYADRVERRATGRTDYRLLLGRTIAHELGHLVLGVTAHSKSGLMREFWTDEELRRNHVQDWAFSPEDRQKMCVMLLSAPGACTGTAVVRATTGPARSPDPALRR